MASVTISHRHRTSYLLTQSGPLDVCILLVTDALDHAVVVRAEDDAGVGLYKLQNENEPRKHES